MYNDLFSIGPVTVHSYGLFTAIGLLAALALATKRAPKKNLNGDICYGILFSGVIFGYLCSKLTYTFVEWEAYSSLVKSEIAANGGSFFKNAGIAIKGLLSNSGFVVIGGLAGGVIAAAVYCKIKKVRFLDYFDLCAPSISIAQGFGRIGCFMAGCCYGKETDSFLGVTFRHSHFAPNNVKLMPTQLISSVGNFLIMAILIYVASKTVKKGLVASLYMILYSVGRFLVEFLRNDARGTIGKLPTSQFFSIFIFAGGILFLVWALKHNEPEEPVVTEEAEPETEEEAETEESSEAETEEVSEAEAKEEV